MNSHIRNAAGEIEAVLQAHVESEVVRLRVMAELIPILGNMLHNELAFIEKRIDEILQRNIGRREMAVIKLTRRPSEGEDITIFFPGGGELKVANVSEAARELKVDEAHINGGFYTNTEDTDEEIYEFEDPRDAEPAGEQRDPTPEEEANSDDASQDTGSDSSESSSDSSSGDSGSDSGSSDSSSAA